LPLSAAAAAQGVPTLSRPDNWPLLGEALKQMGRADLIGSRPDQLVPAHQPPDTDKARP
jgi:hypothetical protein